MLKTVRRDDVTLNVLDSEHDPGSGPPLLFVHGFPLDHTMWRGQTESLAARFRVIAPDLRGFGGSSITPGTVTMEQHADDLAWLLDELGVTGKIVLCGLSMGGYVAWQFQRRHARRLAALVLCDTRAAADSAEAARGRLQTAERVLKEGTGLLIESMLPKLIDKSTPGRLPAVDQHMRRMILAAPPEGVAAALRGMAVRPDVTPDLPTIDTRTLVVVGATDAISPPDEMRSIAAALPHAKFVEVPGVGHMAPLEDPATVNAAMLKFLSP